MSARRERESVLLLCRSLSDLSKTASQLADLLQEGARDAPRIAPNVLSVSTPPMLSTLSRMTCGRRSGRASASRVKWAARSSSRDMGPPMLLWSMLLQKVARWRVLVSPPPGSVPLT